MCVCVCVCVCVCIDRHTHTHIYIDIDRYVPLALYIYIYLYILAEPANRGAAALRAVFVCVSLHVWYRYNSVLMFLSLAAT